MSEYPSWLPSARGTIISSGDGITWTAAASVPVSTELYGVSYSTQGLWIAVRFTRRVFRTPPAAVPVT